MVFRMIGFTTCQGGYWVALLKRYWLFLGLEVEVAGKGPFSWFVAAIDEDQVRPSLPPNSLNGKFSLIEKEHRRNPTLCLELWGKFPLGFVPSCQLLSLWSVEIQQGALNPRVTYLTMISLLKTHWAPREAFSRTQSSIDSQISRILHLLCYPSVPTLSSVENKPDPPQTVPYGRYPSTHHPFNRLDE